ncbi:MAG TPA: hypothetical protein VF423_09885 [Actinomycetes bacterium]
MALSAGQQRKAERSVHLVAAVMLLGYIYVPAPPGWAVHGMRYRVFPLLVATGVAMWQAAGIRRYRRLLMGGPTLRSARPVPSAAPRDPSRR